MASVRVNVSELCSRLYGFHNTEEETDVTLYCEGQQFLCHRAALAARSTYFECMFSNVWRENVAGSVTFADDQMKADTLLEILKYVYAGNASLTSSNFVDFLYAGDYLGVLGLEAYCIQNLSQVRPESIVDHLWKALLSPHSVFNKPLISVLESCNFTERLKTFFNTNEFLRIPADLLSIVVKKLWKSPPTMNHILLRAIYRWRAYALNERKEHALKLHKLLEPALENSFKLSQTSLESFSNVSSDLETVVAAPQNPSLYVYTKDIACRFKTFRYNCQDSSDEKFVLKYSHYAHRMIYDSRYVSVHNVGLFGVIGGMEWDYTVFLQFASEDVYSFKSGRALAHPPTATFLWDYDLCNLSNRGLYLMSMRDRNIIPLLPVNPRYDASKREFSVEEVGRGIYFYNIELDRWFPVPAMTINPTESCMTVLDNVVYMMAGKGNRKIVQAYDHRERRWQRKPKTLHNHTLPQSCELDGKIYVSSVRHCERYDPVAARWEDLGYRESLLDVRRLVPYENQLWEFYFDANYMEVYTPRTNEWSTVRSGLSNIGMREQILDVVIW